MRETEGAEAVPLLWERFTEWLRHNAPEDHAVLLPGIGAEETGTLERELGFPLDDGLKALLSVCCGVVPRSASTEPGAFVFGHSLLDAAGIVEWQRYFADAARDLVADGYGDNVGALAHPAWVPFAQAVTGDLLFIDHRDGHRGAVGEMFFGSPEYRPLWPGVAEMLRAMCVAVETDTPLPELGWKPVVWEGRMLEWD
ncbi:SMI1/KNR4 family protein [Streptomyces sp. JNUCC 64]